MHMNLPQIISLKKTRGRKWEEVLRRGCSRKGLTSCRPRQARLLAAPTSHAFVGCALPDRQSGRSGIPARARWVLSISAVEASPAWNCWRMAWAALAHVVLMTHPATRRDRSRHVSVAAAWSCPAGCRLR
jgi:hypothetical protein